MMVKINGKIPLNMRSTHQQNAALNSSIEKHVVKEAFEKRANVSRETLADYTAWYQLLRKWNAKINLVAPATLDVFWNRHALDSWQICPLLPSEAKVILDLGSGAGFPAIAAAIDIKHKARSQASNSNDGIDIGPAAHIHLVESAGKKAAFLKTVIRELKLPATVHNLRIEDLAPMQADVISARAFAPLPRLFQYALPHIHAKTQLILPKGETARDEIESASTSWTFSLETVKSITQDGANILIVKDLALKA